MKKSLTQRQQRDRGGEAAERRAQEKPGVGFGADKIRPPFEPLDLRLSACFGFRVSSFGFPATSLYHSITLPPYHLPHVQPLDLVL